MCATAVMRRPVGSSLPFTSILYDFYEYYTVKYLLRNWPACTSELITPDYFQRVSYFIEWHPQADCLKFSASSMKLRFYWIFLVVLLLLKVIFVWKVLLKLWQFAGDFLKMAAVDFEEIFYIFVVTGIKISGYFLNEICSIFICRGGNLVA